MQARFLFVAITFLFATLMAVGTSAQNISCPGTPPCSLQGSCNNGTCFCNLGFAQADCSQCDTGYFGVSCASCPGLHRPTGVVCSGNGFCSEGKNGSGVCSCSSNYYLDDCSEKEAENEVFGPIMGSILAAAAVIIVVFSFRRYYKPVPAHTRSASRSSLHPSLIRTPSKSPAARSLDFQTPKSEAQQEVNVKHIELQEDV